MNFPFYFSPPNLKRKSWADKNSFFLASTQPFHRPLDCLMNRWIGKENCCSCLQDKPTRKKRRKKKKKRDLSETLKTHTNLRPAAERGSARWDPSARPPLSSASSPLHNTTQHNTREEEKRRDGVSASADQQDVNAGGRMHNRCTSAQRLRLSGPLGPPG